MFLSLLFGVQAHATEVLLPHFSPGGFSDLILAEDAELKLLRELGALEVQIVPPAILDQEYDIAMECYENPMCAKEMLKRAGSKMLITGLVQSEGDNVQIQLRLYSPSDSAPIQIITKVVPRTGLDQFFKEQAQEINVILQLLSTAPPPVEEPIRIEEQVIQKPPSSDVPEIRGLPQKYRDEYDNSPLTPKDWLAEQRVRTHNLIVNFSSGVAFGDVTRRYDIRVGYYQDKNTLIKYGQYEYDTFHYDSGFQATIGIGFAPAWWLEMALHGGVMLGSKELSTGWEQRHVDNISEVLMEDELAQIPVTAAVAQIEPILRWYMVPTGPVKPYVLTGASIRIFDGYQVPDLENVDYPDRPGGVHIGAMAGGGIAFDSLSPVSVFAEIPYIYYLNYNPYLYYATLPQFENIGIDSIPDQSVSSSQIITFRAGITLRY